MKSFREYENIDERCEECIFEHEMEGISEAEYQGKKVSLNNPFRTPDGPKKFAVYVTNEKEMWSKLLLVTLIWKLKEMTQTEERILEQDIIVTIHDQRPKQDIGPCYQWRKGAKVDN